MCIFLSSSHIRASPSASRSLNKELTSLPYAVFAPFTLALSLNFMLDSYNLFDV